MQSDPTVRSRCLHWLLSVVRRGLWELVLEPGTNSLCHALLGEKFRHPNLGSKHRQRELRCSSERGDLLYIFTCPTELLTALLTIPFKVHVCKHLFKYEIRWGVGWTVSVSAYVVFSDGKHFSLCLRRFKNLDILEPRCTSLHHQKFKVTTIMPCHL